MPTLPDSDFKCTAKKLHIGNDFVSIVYNDSATNVRRGGCTSGIGAPPGRAGGGRFRLATIRSQFGMACVTITPLPFGVNGVSLQLKDGWFFFLGILSISR